MAQFCGLSGRESVLQKIPDSANLLMFSKNQKSQQFGGNKKDQFIKNQSKLTTVNIC